MPGSDNKSDNSDAGVDNASPTKDLFSKPRSNTHGGSDRQRFHAHRPSRSLDGLPWRDIAIEDEEGFLNPVPNFQSKIPTSTTKHRILQLHVPSLPPSSLPLCTERDADDASESSDTLLGSAVPSGEELSEKELDAILKRLETAGRERTSGLIADDDDDGTMSSVSFEPSEGSWLTRDEIGEMENLSLGPHLSDCLRSMGDYNHDEWMNRFISGLKTQMGFDPVHDPHDLRASLSGSDERTRFKLLNDLLKTLILSLSKLSKDIVALKANFVASGQVVDVDSVHYTEVFINVIRKHKELVDIISTMFHVHKEMEESESTTGHSPRNEQETLLLVLRKTLAETSKFHRNMFANDINALSWTADTSQLESEHMLIDKCTELEVKMIGAQGMVAQNERIITGLKAQVEKLQTSCDHLVKEAEDPKPSDGRSASVKKGGKATKAEVLGKIMESRNQELTQAREEIGRYREEIKQHQDESNKLRQEVKKLQQDKKTAEIKLRSEEGQLLSISTKGQRRVRDLKNKEALRVQRVDQKIVGLDRDMNQLIEQNKEALKDLQANFEREREANTILVRNLESTHAVEMSHLKSQHEEALAALKNQHALAVKEKETAESRFELYGRAESGVSAFAIVSASVLTITQDKVAIALISLRGLLDICREDLCMIAGVPPPEHRKETITALADGSELKVVVVTGSGWKTTTTTTTNQKGETDINEKRTRHPTTIFPLWKALLEQHGNNFDNAVRDVVSRASQVLVYKRAELRRAEPGTAGVNAPSGANPDIPSPADPGATDLEDEGRVVDMRGYLIFLKDDGRLDKDFVRFIFHQDSLTRFKGNLKAHKLASGLQAYRRLIEKFCPDEERSWALQALDACNQFKPIVRRVKAKEESDEASEKLLRKKLEWKAANQ